VPLEQVPAEFGWIDSNRIAVRTTSRAVNGLALRWRVVYFHFAILFHDETS
jgi:hypothetical protein